MPSQSAAPAMTLSIDPSRFSEQAGELAQLVESYERSPDDRSLKAQLRAQALVVSRGFVELKTSTEDPSVGAILALALKLHVSGCFDSAESAPGQTPVFIQAAKGWRGILASWLLEPVWHAATPLALESLPLWLWGPYAKLAFTAPRHFSSARQADQYALFVAALCRQIKREVEANKGAAAVRALVNAFLEGSHAKALLLSGANLREYFEVRASILARFLSVGTQPVLPAFSRDFRRLRVGFVVQTLGTEESSHLTLPLYECLDPERFDVLLFSCREEGGGIEEYVRTLPFTCCSLPAEVEAQVDMLREHQLDILVFASDTNETVNAVTRLALYRSAPLQVTTSISSVTTGMSEMDVFVSGTLCENTASASSYSERLALLPEAADAFDFNADMQDSLIEVSRAQLGIAEEAFIYVAVAGVGQLTAEVRQVWADVLSAQEHSVLLLHLKEDPLGSALSSGELCQQFAAQLQLRQVDPSRLVLFYEALETQSDLLRFVSIANVYLAPFPLCDLKPSLAALAQGIPVVTWKGGHLRSSRLAALLSSVGLGACVAEDFAAYLDICDKLHGNAEFGSAILGTLAAAMNGCPRFMDTMAASEDFGNLLARCHDLLVEAGSLDAFRAGAGAICVGEAAPCGLEAHVEAAKQCRLLGRSDWAVKHLLVAVENPDAGGAVWYALAEALLDSGQQQGAIKALETSLRREPSNVEGWLMLANIAEGLGSFEMVADTVDVLRELAPGDVRVLDLANRYPSRS